MIIQFIVKLVCFYELVIFATWFNIKNLSQDNLYLEYS